MLRPYAEAAQGAVSGVVRASNEIADAGGALLNSAANAGQAGFGGLGNTNFAALQIRNTIRNWGWIDEDGDFQNDTNGPIQAPDTLVGKLSEGIAQFASAYALGGRVIGPAAQGAKAIEVAGRGLPP